MFDYLCISLCISLGYVYVWFNVFDYLRIVNFLNYCVDMSDQEQSQQIDPSRLIHGRCAMTHSTRQERQKGHIPKRGKGRGKGRTAGEGSSHDATQPAESQDPTHEYLNFQDVHDGGYDESEQQHIPEPDANDIAAAVAPETLPVDAPFPGGPETLALLHSYASHVALPLWYNYDNVSVIFLNVFFYMFNYFLYMCVCLIIILNFICVFSICLTMI